MRDALDAERAQTAPVASATLARRGFLLGFVGVFLFALTLPMTKLALQGFSALFITSARAVVAAVLGLFFLRYTRSLWPAKAYWPDIVILALTNVLGFPLLLALAMRQVPASHAAVMTGLLPLCTIAFAVWWKGEKASPQFLACALLGSALVVGFAWQANHGLVLADGYLLLAMLCASAGYVSGAKLTPHLGGLQSIAWALLLALPMNAIVLTMELSHFTRMRWHSIPAGAWLGLAYVSVFSMFIGFWFWFKGLALGGAAKVGQVQLLQAFLSLGAGALILGEAIEQRTLIYAVAVLVVVALGRRVQ